jgi:hypothetical protein
MSNVSLVHFVQYVLQEKTPGSPPVVKGKAKRSMLMFINYKKNKGWTAFNETSVAVVRSGGHAGQLNFCIWLPHLEES